MFKSIIIFGLCAIFSVSATRNKRQAQQCYTPDNNFGVCVTLSNCPYLGNLYAQNAGSQQVVNYLLGVQRSCGTRNIRGDPVVCCAQNFRQQTPPTQTRPTQTRQTRPIQTGPTQAPSSFRPPSFPPTASPTEPISAAQRADGCTGPDGVAGVCKGLKECQPLLTRLQSSPQDSSFATFLRLSNEICRVPPPTVCCPLQTVAPPVSKPPPPKPTLGGTENVNTIPTPEDGCGISNNTFKKIVGGEPAKLGAWPWIALIGYRDSFGTNSFKCGGALITQRHVLTAAHCIRTDLKFTRLGEHDLNIETETSYVDIDVVKSTRHPNYNSRDGHSDLAVLRLARGAPFTNLIRPACLPSTPQLRAKSYVNYTPFVAGWGKTQEGGKSAQILQELQIPVHANAVCKDRYQRLNRLVSAQQFDQAVICAGVLAGGKDTCQGDSGGPLMIPEPFQGGVRFYVIGVVSYGIGCARPEVPGIYTSVANFMDWILQQVADNS